MISNAHRFHGRSSIRFVYQRGQMVRGQLVALRYARNDRQQAYRAAVVVSRKVSKSAVVRNRIRRRIYEIVRNTADQIVGPYDLVFTVYGDDVAGLPHDTLRATILGQLQKAGVVRRPAGPSGAKRATIDQKEI
jgi:ribonuclease P protein component